MAAKSFVIDTNVVLHDPEAILKFPGHNVVIPVNVLNELDSKKKSHDELGRNARGAIRLLDSLKSRGTGDLHRGVRIDNGSLIRIQLEMKTEMAHRFFSLTPDDRIILAAVYLRERGEDVVFVSKDFAARVKAEAMGLVTEDYRNFKAPIEQVFRSIRQITLPKAEIDTLFKDGQLTIELEDGSSFYPNEYCYLVGPERTSALGIYNAKSGKVESLLPRPKDIWGIQPLNIQQACAIDLLLREEIPLVTLVGPAGTGKTLVALACGLRKVFDEASYSRMFVSRPIMPFGKDIGFLPGSKEEKLYNWMQPIHDNLEFLCESGRSEPTDTLRWILESNKLEMEALTYIRGRTLPKVYIIIDEAQNLTPHELKTIISRAGANTKVVLTGDPTQIDNPYLDMESNGLTYIVSRFLTDALHGHIYLEKTERSQLAARAAEIL